MSIAENIAQIRTRIDAACRRCDRDTDKVHLLAVSKVKPAADIMAAFEAGQIRFGESYVQEFVDKVDGVTAPVEWHFIGGLQTNKVKYLRGQIAMIHSVDRLSLAREIDKQWGKIEQPIDILLQVNVGDEDSKSGTTAQQLEALTRACSELPWLRVKGLMCLPPWAEDPEQVRPHFRQLRQLAEAMDALNLPQTQMDELSMGMSHDFEVAIEEGATLVRVGTAIFGARPPKGAA